MATRRYDSSGRRAVAARTRDRIVGAAVDLARGLPGWDWQALTVRAVAERAGVSERSVYRHFGSERDLHDAVVQRLRDDAGVDYARLRLEDLPGAGARTVAALGAFAGSAPAGTAEPALLAEHGRRREALLRVLEPHARDWTDEQRTLAAASLDVLWDVPAYQRLVAQWGLDGDQAARAVTWAMTALVTAIRDAAPPPDGELPLNVPADRGR